MGKHQHQCMERLLRQPIFFKKRGIHSNFMIGTQCWDLFLEASVRIKDKGGTQIHGMDEFHETGMNCACSTVQFQRNTCLFIHKLCAYLLMLL
jgi:hypothetical protein